jgi:membrane-associated phospholipid phosphatase
MSTDQDQDQDQDQFSGPDGAPVRLRSVPNDLPPHPLTLDFTPLPGHPQWPLRTLPPAVWDNGGWQFNEKLWDPTLYALQLLQDFVTTDWVTGATGVPPNRPDWTQIIPFPPPAPVASPFTFLGWYANQPNHVLFIEHDLEELRNLMENDRQRYMAEIVAQADSATLFFLSMLGITRTSRPNSFRLIHAALRIGEYVGMYFKNKFVRIRPSVLAPGLQPPFGPPGHPSFPNNHCLQSFLVARCLEAVTPTDAATGHSIYQYQLNWLAERIAVNRERAGLHYPSDTAGGRFLARHLFDDYLSQWPQSGGAPSRFTQLLTAAQAEWP